MVHTHWPLTSEFRCSPYVWHGRIVDEEHTIHARQHGHAAATVAVEHAHVDNLCLGRFLLTHMPCTLRDRPTNGAHAEAGSFQMHAKHGEQMYTAFERNAHQLFRARP
jgi:hypothetical protein